MINPVIIFAKKCATFTKVLIIIGLGIFIVAPIHGASPPKQLAKVIKEFMEMDSTSLEIQQVIDWRFSSDHDSLSIRMDINAGQNFHVMLPAFGMEIFVSENQMLTINHNRQQILLEDASPDALLEQIFVGGNINDARFKKEQKLGQGLRQLDFKFAGDFSDWESLSVVLDDNDKLKKMILVDYDGNKYLITLNYLPRFSHFELPIINEEYLHYQTADLRGN